MEVSSKLLTVKEVAKILRVSDMTVYRLVKSRQISAIRVGKNYRVKESEVERYLNRANGLLVTTEDTTTGGSVQGRPP